MNSFLIHLERPAVLRVRHVTTENILYNYWHWVCVSLFSFSLTTAYTCQVPDLSVMSLFSQLRPCFLLGSIRFLVGRGLVCGFFCSKCYCRTHGTHFSRSPATSSNASASAWLRFVPANPTPLMLSHLFRWLKLVEGCVFLGCVVRGQAVWGRSGQASTLCRARLLELPAWCSKQDWGYLDPYVQFWGQGWYLNFLLYFRTLLFYLLKVHRFE